MVTEYLRVQLVSIFQLHSSGEEIVPSNPELGERMGVSINFTQQRKFSFLKPTFHAK